MSYVKRGRAGLLVPRRLSAQMSASYESGSATGSRNRNWNPTSAGPNASAVSGLNLQRRRARDAVRNDPWASTAAQRWDTNVIGTGIQPYPRHPDREIRRQLKQLWADWGEEADADGQLDVYGLQSLGTRGVFVDGEHLVRLRHRRPQDGLTVPLQLQAIEGDQLPVELCRQLPNGGEIVNGVEFDAIGRRVAYHLLRRHPGERGRGFGSLDTVRVPADQIVHTYALLRPGQVRGVTALATVLLRLKSIDNLDDAVMYRQEVANLFAGFITRPESQGAPDDPMGTGQGEVDDDGTPIASLEPGTMQELGLGESVTFSSPPDAGDNYEPFMRQQLMAAMASVGLPYELATGDLRNVSDRTLRVLVNEFHRRIQQHQWHVVIHQYCRPIWAAWMDALALSGRLPMPDYFRNRREWLRVLWVPQGWPYFNPVQDVEANTKAVRAGFTSRSAIVLGQGDDPDQVIDDVTADNEMADEAGHVFDSDARKTSATGRPLADEPEPAATN